jgi:hypothetical protein
MIHELMWNQPCSKPMSSFSRSVIHFDGVLEPERGWNVNNILYSLFHGEYKYKFCISAENNYIHEW